VKQYVNLKHVCDVIYESDAYLSIQWLKWARTEFQSPEKLSTCVPGGQIYYVLA